jgi:hypothetical protein
MKLQAVTVSVFILIALASAFLHPGGRLLSAQPDNSRPDNSRTNAPLARTLAPLTADDQPNDRIDRQTAARVRRVIMADDSLSIYAQNVKIIVAAGKVTLEGPVHTSGERQEVALDAASVVSPSAIVDNITVA